MDVINNLNDLSSSNELDTYLSNNIDYVFQEFINQKQNILSENRVQIENYIVRHYRHIKQIDLSLNHNQIFLDILIDISERVGFSMYFQRLCRIKSINNSQVSLRNEASLLYLKRIRNIEDFENIQKSIFDKLQQAFEEQEDNNKKVTASLLGFYKRLVSGFINTNKSRLFGMIENLKIQSQSYSFYDVDTLNQLFNIDLENNPENIIVQINSLINNLFAFEDTGYLEQVIDYLIEVETDYINKLDSAEQCIFEIRNISVDKIIDSDKSILGRGVGILIDEVQLYQYMYSYGKMHYAKCLYSFDFLDDNFFENDIEIIDWGCGQALASMTFLYFLNNNNIHQNVFSTTLIEPSELALKRGALHVKKFTTNSHLKTIKKKLDELSIKDFVSVRESNVKLHLFSNILDIDSYSTINLVNLIKERFIGLNYFVIVSPYITELKTNRINLFVESFEYLNGFEMLNSEDYLKGKWQNGWSMVIRIFKVEL